MLARRGRNRHKLPTGEAVGHDLRSFLIARTAGPGASPKTDYPRSATVTVHLDSLNRFLRNEDGPTAVEYSVMLALVVMACIAAVMLLGTNTSASFSDSQEKITEAMNSGS